MTTATMDKPGGQRWALVPTHVLDSMPDAQTRALLTHLAGLADRQGIAFQSHQRMADALGISRATLYRWQARLEATGAAVRIGGGFRKRIVRWAVTALQGAGPAAVMQAAMTARYAARRTFRSPAAIARAARERRLEGAAWRNGLGRPTAKRVSSVRPVTAKDENLKGLLGGEPLPKRVQLNLLSDEEAFMRAVQAHLDGTA